MLLRRQLLLRRCQPPLSRCLQLPLHRCQQPLCCATARSFGDHFFVLTAASLTLISHTAADDASAITAVRALASAFAATRARSALAFVATARRSSSASALARCAHAAPAAATAETRSRCTPAASTHASGLTGIGWTQSVRGRREDRAWAEACALRVALAEGCRAPRKRCRAWHVGLTLKLECADRGLNWLVLAPLPTAAAPSQASCAVASCCRAVARRRAAVRAGGGGVDDGYAAADARRCLGG